MLRSSSMSLGILAASLSVPAALSQIVLDTDGTTLTNYQAGFTSVQSLRPAFYHRGAELDGSPRKPSALGWALAADPLGGGHGGGRLGDLDLRAGTFNPTEIDLALPTLGPPVVIGRHYSNIQYDDTGAPYMTASYQGQNWSQIAQPEVILVDGATDADDVLYIVYGADRFIELRRVSLTASEFKAKNGAAGVAQIVGGSTGTIIYTDAQGTQVEFFGTNRGAASGQWWRTTDRAGQVAYAGHATNSASAISSGYDGAGRVLWIYDASGRRYGFTYSTVGSDMRLTQVRAEQLVSSTWTTVGLVDYSYYTTAVNHQSNIGDLRSAKITTPVAGSTDQVRQQFYRYYTAWANTDGQRGSAHQIKLAVGFEGARRADLSDSTFNDDFMTWTDDALKPYADAWMEYSGTSDHTFGRVTKAFFNGQCGCGGGTNGTYEFTYQEAAGYGTAVANTAYDTGWGTRTIVKQPDGTYITQHFDETAQALHRVHTNTDPAGSPTRRWVTDVDRNASGQVTAVYAPAANSAYTHSTGATTRGSTGLVTVYGRVASGNLAGLRESVSVKNGTGGSAVQVSGVALSGRTLVVGASGVTVPVVDSSSSYPTAGGSAVTTTYTTTYWSGTNTNVEFLAPKEVAVSSPAVSTGNNGSGTATSSSRYLRKDGSVVFTKDAVGIIGYAGRDAFGRTDKQITDANPATTGDFASGDAPSTWGLAATGTPYHIISTMTYDLQSRMVTATRPGVNGNRTSAMAHVTLSDRRLGSFSFPRQSGGLYYGPASYSITNHAGRAELQASIAIPGGSSSLPSTTPGSSWSRLTTSLHDESGAKLLESRAYHTIASYPGSGFDATIYGHDNMGRVRRVQDPTGTVRRTVYDERGFATESWVGTIDSSFPGGSPGTDNMTKTDTTTYDGGASGGNGLVTSRTQDADGNWATTGDQRTTSVAYDFRNRAVLTTSPSAPHSLTKYDNLGRVLASGQYSSTAGLSTSSDPTSVSSNRLALSESLYDARGQVYRTTSHEVNQSTGALGGSITTDLWYDAAGRSVKSQGASISKTLYDRLGRATASFTLSATNDTTYAHALDAAGDTVVEERRTGIHTATGLPLIQHSILRTTAVTGPLDTNADGNDLTVTAANITGRASITATWYDDWDRPIDTVSYGDNGAATLARSGLSVPARSDTALRTSTSYDDHGRGYDVTDADGRVHRTTYDDLGRTLKTIRNYTDGTPGGGTNNDQDQVVEYGYASGLNTTVTRKMVSSADDQVTTNQYGTVKGSGASISTGHLLKTVVYPEQIGGQATADRSLTYRYNALGEVTGTTDPAGNQIDLTFDTRGRVTVRTATVTASGFDSRVYSVETDYTSRGQVSAQRQKNVSAAVLDELTYAYDGWGNLTTQTHDPDSAVGVSGRSAFTTTWSWSKNTAGWQNMKLNSVTQPGGVTVTHVYSGSTPDSAVARPTRLRDQNNVDVVGYGYWGAGHAASYDQPETSGWMDEVTYDRFHRPTDTRFRRDVLVGGVGPDYVTLYRSESTYNRSGQLVTGKDLIQGTGTTTNTRVFDGLYEFDALNRLIKLDEGELNSGGTAIATRSREQIMNRGLSGTVSRDRLSLDGNQVYTNPPPASSYGELDDSRTSNKRNELRTRVITDSDNPSGRTVNLSYDRNGGLTDDGDRFTYKYNPWGQLVEIWTRGGSPALRLRYTYNAMGVMQSEQTDTNAAGNTGVADGAVDSNDPTFYYATDSGGQRTAVFRGSDADPKETYINHAKGRRGPVVRDRDDALATDVAGWARDAAQSVRYERYYFVNDRRGDVVALLSSVGTLVESYRYSATGMPFGQPLGDVNSDGTVAGGGTGADFTQADWSRTNTYRFRSDVDLDGSVTFADTGTVTAEDGQVRGRANFSRAAVRNTLGKQSRPWLQPARGWQAGKGVLSAELGRRIGDLGDFVPDPLLSQPVLPGYMPDGPIGVCAPIIGCSEMYCQEPTNCGGNVSNNGDPPVGVPGDGIWDPYPVKLPIRFGEGCPTPSPRDIEELTKAAVACAIRPLADCNEIQIVCKPGKPGQCEGVTDHCTITVTGCSNGYGFILKHESRHVWQNCWLEGTFADVDCNERMRRELDAYLYAGQCHRNRTPDPNDPEDISCCGRACRSLLSGTWCYLSFRSCMNDCAKMPLP